MKITKHASFDLIVHTDAPFVIEITMHNAGQCTWYPGIYLRYVSGERFDLPQRVEMNESVVIKPGMDATFLMRGNNSSVNGLFIGIWELRNIDGARIGSPFVIKYLIYN